MKFFKGIISVVLLLLVAVYAHARSIGGGARLQQTPQQRPTQTPLQQPLQQPIIKPKTYAQALEVIRTKMPSNQIIINNTFTKSFIDFVTSLDLSLVETKALLEAGANLHATLSNDDITNKKILLSFTNTIQELTGVNPRQPVQPISPMLPVTPPQQPIQPPLPVAPIVPPIQPKQPIRPSIPQFELVIGTTRITIVRGDLVKQKVDAIVNTANEQLEHAAGVALAISHAAGPQLQQYSNAMPTDANGKRCPAGQAVITPAFNLENVGIKKIIHTVVPRGNNPNKAALLKNAYQSSLQVAKNNGLKSIAFPPVSTAIFGDNKATPIAFAAMRDFIQNNPNYFNEIRFVLRSNEDIDVYKSWIHELKDSSSFSLLVDMSNKFNEIGTFPTENNRIEKIAGNDQNIQQTIVEHASNTYPLLHSNTLTLLDDFLNYKRKSGSTIEKQFYALMSSEQFINRLVEQRPLMFMTDRDQYLLRSNKTTGYGGFEKIGTTNEKSPLILKDYLSYDEMAIAALIGMSVPTYFINNGARDNRSNKGADNTYEKEGIYAGLVGARFEKPGYMEWQHMIITPEQNTPKHGYGLMRSNKDLLSLWSKFYNEKFPTFDEAKNDTSGRFVVLANGSYFDKEVYKKRIRFVVEPFLLDANKRAMAQKKKAYVHVVGLGLGVWQIDERQAQWMLEAYATIINDNTLSHISDIDFSWFSANAQSIDGIKDGQFFKGNNNHILIHFSKRNPADKLLGNDMGKLLVAMYAWDGNSYPGNEYWAGMLTASGDPAAACCSTIPELQNPKINPYIKANIRKILP